MMWRNATSYTGQVSEPKTITIFSTVNGTTFLEWVEAENLPVSWNDTSGRYFYGVDFDKTGIYMFYVIYSSYQTDADSGYSIPFWYRGVRKRDLAGDFIWDATNTSSYIRGNYNNSTTPDLVLPRISKLTPGGYIDVSSGSNAQDSTTSARFNRTTGAGGTGMDNARIGYQIANTRVVTVLSGYVRTFEVSGTTSSVYTEIANAGGSGVAQVTSIQDISQNEVLCGRSYSPVFRLYTLPGLEIVQSYSTNYTQGKLGKNIIAWIYNQILYITYIPSNTTVNTGLTVTKLLGIDNNEHIWVYVGTGIPYVGKYIYDNSTQTVSSPPAISKTLNSGTVVQDPNKIYSLVPPYMVYNNITT
jgi:hypothetical protein